MNAKAQTIQDAQALTETSVALFGTHTTIVFIMSAVTLFVVWYMLRRDTQKDKAHEEEKDKMREIYTKIISEKDKEIRETESDQWKTLYTELDKVKEMIRK